jgi:hypothetical protein
LDRRKSFHFQKPICHANTCDQSQRNKKKVHKTFTHKEGEIKKYPTSDFDDLEDEDSFPLPQKVPAFINKKDVNYTPLSKT